MCAEYQYVAARVCREELLACLSCGTIICIEHSVQSRQRELDGVVRDIAGDYALFTARPNTNAYMSRGVTRCRKERDFFRQLMVLLYQIVQPGVDDRRHGIGDNRSDIKVVFCAVFIRASHRVPVLPFEAAKEVACVGKGRNPHSINPTRVPSHVIDMQVRAHHQVNRLGGLTSVAKLR